MNTPRRALFVVLAALGSFVVAEAADAPPRSLGSTVFNWADLKVKTSPKGEGRFVVDAPTPTFEKLEIHITTLNPGFDSHPPHHHPQEEMLLIKEGTLQPTINGVKQQPAGPGSLIFFASHDVHNATNVGDKPTTYYVINYYTAATQTVRNQPAAEWEPAELLHSSVITWDSLKPVTGANDVRRMLVNSPTLTFSKLEVHATTVAPGAPASKAHRHPWAQLVVIKDGTMEATIDGMVQTAGPGSLIYLASNALQSLRNPGTVPSTYFVISVTSEATPKA